MKKVLVLAAVLAMAAAPAFAGTIINSKHDLSSGSTTTGAQADASGTDEICVFCHTPHSASAAGFAPLWNRTTANATAIYTGVDIQNTATLATVNASDAPLCLSCHDGSSLTDALINPPNVAATPLSGVANIPGANAANLGKDLRNDHPVGFNYDAVAVGGANQDLEIDTRANATAEVATIEFYGTSNNMMWCSSCHDVHDPTNGSFLVTKNTESQLCLACHIK